MARTALADVIAFTRKLVNDQTSSTWTDDDVQEALDRYRVELRYVALSEVPTMSGSDTVYRTFDVPDDYRYLETDAEVFDNSFGDLSASVSSVDYTAGRWEMSTDVDRPVYVLGWSHDPYGAAADLLEERLAALAEAYDIRLGPDSFSRSQMREFYVQMVERYRARSRWMGTAETMTMVRPDVN